MWEILDEGLRRKVEIEWKNISAIRASIEENKPRNLEIEVHLNNKYEIIILKKISFFFWASVLRIKFCGEFIHKHFTLSFMK